MEMKIKAIVTNQYGRKRIFVTDKEQREAISQLTGSKTLIINEEKNINHVEALKKLGFEVEITDPEAKV